MAPSQKSVFQISDIHVTRGDRDILRGIDWQVNPGENWVLIGGNGSGKTSLLRVLMGYLTPSQGEIEMADRNAAVESGKDWDEWRKRIGFVSSSIAELIEPSEPAIDVVMAGRHAMVNYWQRDPSVEKEDTAAAIKVLKQVQCEHLANQPWAYLSQGERQRLLIGRALTTPQLQVLILDEPCAGLDPVARENFLNFLQQLTAKGSFKSLVMVTHHVEEIIANITHALILKDGQVIASGEKREALSSQSISAAFEGELTLRSRQGRYRIYIDEEDALPGQVV